LTFPRLLIELKLDIKASGGFVSAFLSGKEVKRDEKDSEQKGSCQGGRLLEQLQECGERESWQDMPQVKELKELKSPVGDETSWGR
jgi:hypothetical protein